MNIGIVFQKPHLAWLWASQLFSVIGDHLFMVALTWIAIEKAGSSAAWITAAGTATALVCGLIGGVYADRLNRRVTMMRVDLLRALVVALLPLADKWVGLQLWHCVVVVVIVEALSTLYDPCMQASLPELCGDRIVLQSANALMDGTNRLARVLGPGLTSFFLLLLVLPHFFLVDAGTFVFSALVLFFLKAHFPRSAGQQAERDLEKRSLLTEIAQSLRMLKGHRTLCFALASLGVVNVAWSAVYATGIPLLTAGPLSGSIGSYGYLVGAYGIGNVVSLFVMSMLPFRMNIKMMFIGQLILGTGFLLLSVSSTLSMAMFATALAAFGSPMGDLIMLTMIQSDFPREHIGKIYSLRRLISGMGLLLGSMIAVPVFSWVSVASGIQGFACFILLAGLAGVWKACIRRT